MRILIVGGGGREHALCWRLGQSASVDRLYAAPGNAGIGELATLVHVSAGDIPGLVEFAERESIDLTVVGPEAPLVAGLVDEMESRGMPVFGPTREAARIEGSKVWARELCQRHGIPAPRSRAFDDVHSAIAFLDELSPPYVVKADGIAAGKGVVIAEDQAEARVAVEACLVQRMFGDAGLRVLIEEFVEGTEVTAMALTDGRAVRPLALSRDYKRALDDDQGPNTGGMGAYSPVPSGGADVEAEIEEVVLAPAVRALEEEGIRYRGVLYGGLMLTKDGPKVLEFNCRFGDPEAQVVLPRLVANLPELLLASLEGNLSHYQVAWAEGACVGVVLASAGYPGPVETGRPISGLADAAGLPQVQVFHAGTVARDGRVVTAGGRVLTVTALGKDHEEARTRAYEACSRINFDGMAYRKDIAADAMEGAA
ncbi:MAG: phosphoribosylamine--glycine ligase [Actinobacteria bacterium]|nr:MAG: phosphoribosylamine--glycine ligase [Actinomycetota bacterium]